MAAIPQKPAIPQKSYLSIFAKFFARQYFLWKKNEHWTFYDLLDIPAEAGPLYRDRMTKYLKNKVPKINDQRTKKIKKTDDW